MQKLLLTDSQIREGWLDKTNVLKYIAEHGSAQAASWPSFYITHGDKDQAVPVEQSRDAASKLMGLGTSVTYEEVKGRNHLWDMIDTGSDDENMSGFWLYVTKTLG